MAEWTWTVPATVVRVIDGDTIVVTLDLGWRVYRNEEHIRVAGINTPEIRGPEREQGAAAKAHAESLLPVGSSVLVTSQAKPTFERTTGTIKIPPPRRLRDADGQGRPRSPGRGMIVYGVVSVETQSAVELFVRREDAEEMVDEWRRDEPQDAGLLRVEEIELE